MKPATKKKLLATVSLTVLAVSVIVAVVFMLRGDGLQPDLDFGAGAYYYADIPDFDKYGSQSESVAQMASIIPMWAYIAIFLGWGALMYWLWTKI